MIDIKNNKNIVSFSKYYELHKQNLGSTGTLKPQKSIAPEQPGLEINRCGIETSRRDEN